MRWIAATNRDLSAMVEEGTFREDLFYRIHVIPIELPALKDRKEDIPLLFRKFVSDFSDKYKSTPVQLDDEAKNVLINYPWPGNVRELKNIAEQISVVEENRHISAHKILEYLPSKGTNLPSVISGEKSKSDFASEREIMYKILFDMRRNIILNKYFRSNKIK